MGQMLSSPATTKVSATEGNDRLLYAVSQMQGWRITMEDAHATLLDLDGQGGSNAFFAVYDGHGGSTVARYAGKNVHKRLVDQDAYRQKQYEAALREAFLGTDEELRANPAHLTDPSGCTAIAALVTSDKVYVANAGDSRSIISVSGAVKPLSFDHKPNNEVERTRIFNAGGFVEAGRVNGNLALSRALGDFGFKKNYDLSPEAQVVTSNPDITVHELTSEDEFFVLACDGIWDCMSSQDVIDFVRRKVWEGIELTKISEALCDHCLAPDKYTTDGIGCDNMTVLIVALLQGRTHEEWYSWIHDRVESGHFYETPKELRQLFQNRRPLTTEQQVERLRLERRNHPLANSRLAESSALGGLARVFGGGISFHPDSSLPDEDEPDTLMFGRIVDENDGDDDALGDEMSVDHPSHAFHTIVGFGDPMGEDYDLLVEDNEADVAARFARLRMSSHLQHNEHGYYDDGETHVQRRPEATDLAEADDKISLELLSLSKPGLSPPLPQINGDTKLPTPHPDSSDVSPSTPKSNATWESPNLELTTP